MRVYACEVCGYEYHSEIGDPLHGIEAKTDFEELPAEWCCPLCGASKDDFEQIEEDEDATDDDDLLE